MMAKKKESKLYLKEILMKFYVTKKPYLKGSINKIVNEAIEESVKYNSCPNHNNILCAECKKFRRCSPVREKCIHLLPLEILNLLRSVDHLLHVFYNYPTLSPIPDINEYLTTKVFTLNKWLKEITSITKGIKTRKNGFDDYNFIDFLKKRNYGFKSVNFDDQKEFYPNFLIKSIDHKEKIILIEGIGDSIEKRVF